MAANPARPTASIIPTRSPRAHLTWNEENLDRWITNAQKMVPGAVMMYRQADPEKRKLVISYLKTLGASGQGQAQESTAKSN